MRMDTTLLRRALPVAAAVTLGLTGSATAADGDLDTTFNGGGIATWKLGSMEGAEAPSLAYDGAGDSDGRIVVVGEGDVNEGTRFAVGQLMANSDPADTFSGDGKETTLVGVAGTARAA